VTHKGSRALKPTEATQNKVSCGRVKTISSDKPAPLKYPSLWICLVASKEATSISHVFEDKIKWKADNVTYKQTKSPPPPPHTHN
jgi:hypothetical protein